jgi:hypothetical protein
MNEGMQVTIILGSIIAVIFAIGILDVYAERSTIEVPFDYHGTQCTFDQESVTYTCIWEGNSETITKKGIHDAGEVPPEQLAEESKEAHETAVELRDEVEIKQTDAERILERLADKIDRGSASDADLELYRVMKEVQTKCYFGIEEGRLIQKFQEFNLPDTTTDTNPNTNLSFRTNNALKQIYLLLEACEAWNVYKVEQLGAEYLNKIKDDSTTQIYHGNNPIASSISPYKTHDLTPEDYANSAQQAQDQICGHSFYSNQYKRDAGCFADIEELNGKGIEVNTPAYRAYLLYKATDYVDINTLKHAEEERIIQESLKSFAERMGIDLADLKNLVQNVDEYNENKIKEAEKP